MALTEDKILVSVEVNVQSNSVAISWANRIMRDGEVVQSIPHRGSWPLGDDGEPVGVKTTEIGAKLSQILSEAGAMAVQQLADERLITQSLVGQLDSAMSEIRRLEDIINAKPN